MQIEGLNNINTESATNTDIIKKSKINGVVQSKIDNSQNNINQNKIQGEVLTKNERDFFVNLFPKSSEQIEKHIIFNRNGRIQSAPVSKGIVIDGKA